MKEVRDETEYKTGNDSTICAESGCISAMVKGIRRFFMHTEWNISLWSALFGTGGIVASFALPAWAVKATDAFSEYSPASWVAAGFAGLLLFVIIYALFVWAFSKWQRTKYDRNLYDVSGFVDPMKSTFEDKRIFLGNFLLPSDPYLEGKTFINCEIIGPANLFMRRNCQINEHKLPVSDAIVLNEDASFYNGVTLDNCTFRKCSFRRITIMAPPMGYESMKQLPWFKWISTPIENDAELNQPKSEAPVLQLPQGTEPEKQP